MKQLEVQILGQSYLLGCPEGGQARLLDAVERVDTAMCKIRDAGKVKARDRIAVLAALNLAFDVADRGVAVAAAAAPHIIPVSAPAPAPTPLPVPVPVSARPPAARTGPDPRLAALIARLDAALAGDGQLL